MKKVISLVLTTIMAAALFTGCGSSSSSSAGSSTLDKVHKEKKLVVAVDDTFPPMEYRDENNKLVGFDVDLGEALSKKLGYKIEFQPTAWDGIFMGLKNKKFDAVFSSVSQTAAREKEMSFAGPYLMGGQVIAVKSDNSTIKSSKDLSGKVVGAQISTTGEDAAKKIAGVKEVKEYDKATDEFNDLVIGRIDAVVVDDAVAGYYSTKKAGYKILDEKLTKEPIGIAFRLEDKALAQEVYNAFKELKKDGTASKISEKWFGHDAYAEK